MKQWHIVMLALSIPLMAPSPAAAHPEGFSGLRVLIRLDSARVVLTLHTRDMSAWFPPAKYPNYVADVCRELEKQPAELLDLRVDGALLTPAKVRVYSPETGMIEADLDYSISPGAAQLQIWSKHLVMLPRGHQQLLFFEDLRDLPQGTPGGHSLGEQTLTSEEDAATLDLPPPRNAATTVPTTAAAAPSSGASSSARSSPRRISFFALGVEHIVTGYDHLLFLAALLLVCKNLREAAGVVTFFTVAHSITLTLAALNLVRIPGRIVEPAIAVSIVYVGLENIFGRHRFIWRAMVTFGFGLVHGLGFASALREVGLGSSSVGLAMPLLKFSIGLETGQLCIAAVLLRLILALRKGPQFERQWVPACSILVSMLGGYWLVTRLIAG